MTYSEWVRKHTDELETNEVKAFIEECCIMQPDSITRKRRLYEAYQQHVLREPSRVLIPKHRLNRQIRRNYPELVEMGTLFKGIVIGK